MMAILKAYNAKNAEEAAKQMPNELGKITKSISNDYAVKMQLLQSQMLPFPVHYTSDTCQSYSMIIKYTLSLEGKSPTLHEASGTLSLVHLKGKILALYVTAEAGDLELTRTHSKKWVDAIINLNSPPALHNDSYFLESDWNKTAQIVLVVIIVRCIVILIGYFLKRAFTAS